MQDERNFVVWSSANVPGAGMELVNYLPGSNIEKWLKQKVLLAPATTRCAIPQGIFKPTGKSENGGMAALNMIAYGPETNITWPPRPADPKRPWDPEWNVRIRTKSTATAMLGMPTASAAGRTNEQDGGKPQQATPGKGKRLLNAFKHY